MTHTDDGFQVWAVVSHCVVVEKMEELVAATILDEEEDNDRLVYCMSEGATDIFKERKDEGCYSSFFGGGGEGPRSRCY